MIYDYLVVGAGMAGASVGYELSRTARVCLVEGEEQPGLHATGRSAALFAPSYGGPEIRAITRASQDFFQNPPEGFSEYPLLEPRGCLYIARRDQIAHLHGMTDEIAASGGVLTALDREAARASVPLLRGDYVLEAALDAEAMDINVDALHQGFLRGARSAGASLRLGHRIQAATWRGDHWRVQFGPEEIAARVVVNAAGAWADQVAHLFGARPVGLTPLRRTAVLIEPPPGCDVRAWPAVIDCDEQFYFKPDAGLLLLSPADETPDTPRDAHPEELDIAIAVDRVQAALELDVRRVFRSWAGLRTFVRDRNPVIGFDPVAPQFFWCAGQGGYGIQTAPAMGRLAAASALRASAPQDILSQGADLAKLSPERLHVTLQQTPA